MLLWILKWSKVVVITAKYLTSLSQIIDLMDFLSEVSTLYEVEPGPEFRLVASNAKAKLVGSAPSGLYGKFMSDFLPKEFYQNELLPILMQVVKSKEVFRGEHVIPYPGRAVMMDCILSPVVENDRCTHIWVITKHKQEHAELEYLSSIDELTGVSNRRFFLERLGKSFKRYTEHGIEFSIMLIDMDGFKAINDSMGHQMGDDLLNKIVGRMSSCVRDSDLIGRIGGDEFVVLVEDQGSQDTVIDIAGRILGKTQEPFNIDGSKLTITLSIGIVRSHDHQDVKSMLTDADDAMYKAKLMGGNRYVVSE
jgi:diguanylate cyclase (GGDEF)-like protein